MFRTNAKPYQDDFFFASQGLNLLSCVAVTDPAVRQHSDHWPVVARLEVR
jgi:endonuclease/exonuclease/phosphatase family metal-dependent hydrolase